MIITIELVLKLDCNIIGSTFASNVWRVGKFVAICCLPFSFGFIDGITFSGSKSVLYKRVYEYIPYATRQTQQNSNSLHPYRVKSLCETKTVVDSSSSCTFRAVFSFFLPLFLSFSLIFFLFLSFSASLKGLLKCTTSRVFMFYWTVSYYRSTSSCRLSLDYFIKS